MDIDVAGGLHVELLYDDLVGTLLGGGGVLDDECVGVLLEAPVELVPLEELQAVLTAADIL